MLNRIFLASLLLLTSCMFRNEISLNAVVGAISSPMTFTSPLIDSEVKSSSYNFTWTPPLGVGLRPTNTFQVNIYSQGLCTGNSIETIYTNTPNFNLTSIVDKAIYSIGVSSFSLEGVQSPEICSATITGNAIISRLQLAGGHLSLDVDFTNKMAYLGASHGTTALTAVDFSTEESPQHFRTLGTGTTPVSGALSSRGVAVYRNATRLIIASDSASRIELWDLTSDPRGTWTRLGTLTGLTNARKIVKVDTSNPSTTVVTLALRAGLAIVNIAEPAGTMTIARSRTSYSNSHGAGAILGDWMLSPNFNTGSPVSLFNLTTLNLDGTYPFPDQGTGTNMWSATSNASGTKAFVSGVTGGFFSYDPSTPGIQPVNTLRFYTSNTYTNRDATFVSEFGKELVYVAASSSKNILVWDATDIANPDLVGQIELTSMTGEAYGVRVDTVNHRAYVASVGGQFYIVNTEMIPAPSLIANPF